MSKGMPKEYEEAYGLLENHRKMAVVKRAIGSVREPMVSIGSAASIIANLLQEREATRRERDALHQAMTSDLIREKQELDTLMGKYENLLALAGFEDTPEEWLEELL